MVKAESQQWKDSPPYLARPFVWHFPDT